MSSGAEPRPLDVVREELFDEIGKVVADSIPQQDMLAWVAQGPICDRTREHLSASDEGIALYRRMLNEALDQVENGEEPIGVIRDPSENESMISLNREAITFKPFDSKYQDLFDRLDTMETAGEA